MSNTYVANQKTDYNVVIPVYEGPLDLLLNLIERAELDITKVAIAQVTDQYLAHIKHIQVQSPDEVSYFLVIAAKLIQIKSEALLPRPPIREEGEEDPAEALARQLMIYKQFKEIGEWLTEREKAGMRNYLRLAPVKKFEGQIDLEGMGISDLVQAVEDAYARMGPQEEIGNVVVAHRVTIRDKIKLIVKTLRSRGKSRFFSLFGKSRTRLEIVVTFLAILELVKLNRVNVLQKALFEDIHLEPLGDWDENEEFESEFGD